jgi:hypothetical protein
MANDDDDINFNELDGDDDDFNGPIEDFFTISPGYVNHNKKYDLVLSNYDCKVSNLEQIPFERTPRAIYRILERIFEQLLVDVAQTDKIRVRMFSNKLRYPIWTPFFVRSEFSVARIMLEVSRVLQSNQEFRLDETFQITVQHAKVPVGRCTPDIPKLLADKLYRMRALVRVRNSDEICLARALVIGKALADKDKKLYKALINVKKDTRIGDTTKQTEMAVALIAKAGFPIRAFTLEDVKKFQAVLPEYMIVIIGFEQRNQVIQAGKFSKQRIVLLHHHDHFDVITSLPVRNLIFPMLGVHTNIWSFKFKFSNLAFIATSEHGVTGYRHGWVTRSFAFPA